MIVDSKLLNLGEVFLQEIIFYIVCAGESDIDRRIYEWIRKSDISLANFTLLSEILIKFSSNWALCLF